MFLNIEDEQLVLQLDQNESDKILGTDEHDRADVFHNIYNEADDFFMKWGELYDLPVVLDVGVVYGTLQRQAVGRYDWKKQ